MTSIACIVIASLHRRRLLDELVMPSVVAQPFDEIVVVGDYHSGEGYRHLPVKPLWGNTCDALVKREVGVAATNAATLVFLCDDHRLAPKFVENLVAANLPESAIGVPSRFCVRGQEVIGLNMGIPGYPTGDYCGGHAGVFSRKCVQDFPHCLGPFHPNWDHLRSRIHVQRGYELVPLPDCLIEDVDDTPNYEPWN